MREEYKEQLNACLGSIANAAIQDAPPDWTDLCVGYLYDAQENDEFLLFVSEDCGKKWENMVDEAFAADTVYEGVFECKAACEELLRLCRENGHSWSGFSLRVLSDGRFEANFSYDALNQITPYAIQLWRGENLVC